MQIVNSRPRIDYLDGIRALAIGLVLIVHWVSSQFPIAFGGYIGVDIFFVLSGYIITSILWKSNSNGSIFPQYARFMKRRFWRLYPALAGMVLGTIAIYAIYGGAPERPADLIFPGILALTQAYSIYAAGEFGPGSPFAVTWSLSVAWMFYLLWPLVLFAAKRRAMKASALAKWTIVVSLLIYLPSLMQNGHWFYYGPVARIPEILAGAALALFLSDKMRIAGSLRWQRTAHLVGGIGVLAMVAYTVFGPVQWSPVFRFFGLPLAVSITLYLIWLGVRSPAGPVIRFLGRKPLAFVGRISYSLYLWHSIGINLFTRENILLPLPFVAVIAVGFAAIMTGLSYRFLELPFTRPQGRVLGRRKLSDPVRENLGA